MTVNATETAYTSRGFLLAAFDGLLEVTVERAAGLKAANVSGAGSSALAPGPAPT